MGNIIDNIETLEKEEEIVENYCKTRNMSLITKSGLEQLIKEAEKRGYDAGYKEGYDTAYKEWR